jgi:hypothetical protein
MRACGLPFRYARVIPVTHSFRKERENDGHPHQCRGKNHRLCVPRKGGHPPGALASRFARCACENRLGCSTNQPNTTNPSQAMVILYRPAVFVLAGVETLLPMLTDKDRLRRNHHGYNALIHAKLFPRYCRALFRLRTNWRCFRGAGARAHSIPLNPN